jgi:antirestriction protein ArdC
MFGVDTMSRNKTRTSHRRDSAEYCDQFQPAQTRLDIHQAIANKIIAAIERGVGEWKMPWHRPGTHFTIPKNALTDSGYRGSNILSLWIDAQEKAFTHQIWATYRQWSELGAQVRKGEKGSLIVKYGQWTPKDAHQAESAFDQDEENPQRLYAKAAFVFNAAQVEGFRPPEIAPRPDLTERLDHVEIFIANTGAHISFGGNRAFYRHPPADIIVLPDRSSFEPTATSTATETFYGTMLHEISHWSGSKDRLNREHGKRFGDEAYAFEELVAEISSGILCAELGISSSLREDHVQYIGHWLQILKGDKKAIFTAASHATRVSDYLFALQPDALPVRSISVMSLQQISLRPLRHFR